ncbi:MAG TPA: hypothetical protein VNK81_07570 [Thermodesulfobacteriota bacterium]|nr:hypothetical protein [Thermodesulfobacteriota bacterium]
MNGMDVFLILLSIVTVIAVVVVLKTPLFIKDGSERAHKTICFLIAIIAGYVFSSPLGGIILGMVKESFEITLAIHRNLFSQERMQSALRNSIFWFLGGFLGADALEHFQGCVSILSSRAF